MARSRIWAFIKKIGTDIDDQIWNKTGPHGAAELGAALFNGHGYVMYGHNGRHDSGAKSPEAEQQKAGAAEPEPDRQPDRERGGRAM